LPTTAPFIVVQRHLPVTQAIARRVVMTPSVVLLDDCAILESLTSGIHHCAAVEHPPAVVRSPWLVNHARPVVHSLDQRSGTTRAFQPALFGNQDLLALPAGSRITEQLSPGQTGFFAAAADIEPFTKNTTGVLNVRHESCAARPVILVRTPAADWPRRLSWSLLRSPLETVCRSAARDPRIASRLERMIISSLAARSQETADRMIERCRQADHGPLFLRLVNRLASWPTESGVATRRWSEDACTDALRARWIGKRTGSETIQQATAAGYSWAGSLRWISEQALRRPISVASSARLQLFAAGVASSAGWRVAVEQIVRPALERHGLKGEVYRWTSAAALRAVLDGHVGESVLGALVPRAALWLADGGPHPVPPALLAMRRLVNQDRQAPALLLLARIVSTRFKVAVGMMWPTFTGRRDDAGRSEEGWLAERLAARPALPHGGWFPWGCPVGILRLDYEGLESILARHLGTRERDILWPILIDPHLLAAALLAISGHTLSARTQLGTRAGRDRWSDAESALRGTLGRRSAMPGPLWDWVARQLADPELDRRLASLVDTPDPSVETGTPVSLLLQGQSTWASDLHVAGKGSHYRVLRRVFGRPDLMQQHEPYWILQSDVAEVLPGTISRLARWNTSISEVSWRRHANEVARKVLES
jgi:hypothetical protein